MQLNLTIIRAQAGCEKAFTQVYEIFSATTLSYLSQLGVQRQDLDDVQQHIWLSVYKQLHTLSSPYAFKRWLLRIAHHCAYKKFKEPKESEITEDLMATFTFKDEHLDNEYSLDMLDVLPRHFREAIYLFYWLDLSCAEIAMICDLPTNTVKSRLFHARNKLADSAHIKHLKQERSHDEPTQSVTTTN